MTPIWTFLSGVIFGVVLGWRIATLRYGKPRTSDGATLAAVLDRIVHLQDSWPGEPRNRGRRNPNTEKKERRTHANPGRIAVGHTKSGRNTDGEHTAVDGGSQGV